MTAEQAQVLTEFARACRTAARSVSLYPATHPAIQTSLARVRSAAARLVHTREVTIAVLPDTLVIDGKAPARPDAAVLELAGLMHDRLIGALHVQREADGLDWHALLLLLSQSPEDLIAGGGIAKAWSETGRRHFDIREIDYAEILREREGASTEWDQALRLCLRGDVNNLDETALMSLLDELGDSARFGEVLERLQTIAALGEPTISARVGALLELLTRMLEASTARSGESGREDMLQNVAASTAWLTPDMLIGLIEKARATEGQRSPLASEIVGRIEEPTVASFVARSVVRENGASERLALALQLLVPDIDKKERVLSLAREEAAASPPGQEPGFDDLWAQAADMLATYSDETFVSGEYARELSSAPAQALEVERVSDDPPQRIDTWLATVNDAALRELDLSLLLDLLRIDTDATRWNEVTSLIVTDIEQRTRRGEVADAQRLVFALVAEAGNQRPALTAVTASALDTLAYGALARDVASALRTADDGDIEAYGRLCRTVGPRMIGPLAEALLAEDNSRAIRRLRDVLLGFGTAGRETVERLKVSPRATVRRTAIEMLRMLGGQEALADLSAMLDDADPQVQRDAIRAIAQIGSDEAFAILQKALVVGTTSGSRITQQLVSLREAKAVPLLCYVLDHSKPRGQFVDVHTQIIDALGALGPHAESVKTLKAALYRGEWWAPRRTATLRRAAALALKRIASAEALDVLDTAAHNGSRRVRSAAQVATDAGRHGKGKLG
jgi:HEAT repeat protein